jgi:hypothetical protein
MTSKRPGISVELRRFRETKNPFPLAKAALLVFRQGRTLELLYGGYCSVLHRPSPVRLGDSAAELAAILERKGEFVHHGTLYRDRLEELYGDVFALRALPADFISARWESVWREGDRLILGEYGDHARLACITRESCVLSDFYERIPTVRHIHAIQRYGDAGQFLVSVGDTSKFLDLWVVDRSGMALVKRVKRRLAGYTAAEEVNGEYYFGTDFTSRPNFIEALGSGEKFFFPDKAYKLRADIFRGFFNRYIAAISKDLEVLTGRRTLSVFDTLTRQFVFCDHLQLDRDLQGASLQD